MAQPIFVDGMGFYQPHPKAPAFLKGAIKVHPKKFTEWAAQHADAEDRGWLTINLKESGTTGNWYLALDDYKLRKPVEAEKPAEQPKDTAEPTLEELNRWASEETKVDDPLDIPF